MLGRKCGGKERRGDQLFQQTLEVIGPRLVRHGRTGGSYGCSETFDNGTSYTFEGASRRGQKQSRKLDSGREQSRYERPGRSGDDWVENLKVDGSEKGKTAVTTDTRSHR